MNFCQKFIVLCLDLNNNQKLLQYLFCIRFLYIVDVDDLFKQLLTIKQLPFIKN